MHIVTIEIRVIYKVIIALILNVSAGNCTNAFHVNKRREVILPPASYSVPCLHIYLPKKISDSSALNSLDLFHQRWNSFCKKII